VSDEPATRGGLGAAAVRGVRWTSLTRVVAEVVLLGALVVLARLIPPAEFGRYAIVLLVGELALMLPAEGIGTALVQRAEVRRAHLQTGAALALLASLALVALALAAAALVIEPWFGERTAELVRLGCAGFVVAGAGVVPSAVLRRRLAFRRLAVAEMLTTGVRAGVAVGLALAGLDAEALVLGGVAGAFVSTAVLWAGAPPPLPRIDRTAARELLGYGVPAALASLSWVGYRNGDYAIVGAQLGAAQAGLYFRAYQLAVEYQRKVSGLMVQVGFPVLARAADAAERARLRRRMVRLLTMLMFPLLAVLAIVAPVLVPWAFGPAWEGASEPTRILAIGGAATLVIDAVGTALMAAGRPRALLGFGWAHFLVYAGAVVVVAPRGLAWVAAAGAVVHSAFVLVAYAVLLHGSLGGVVRHLVDDVAPATVACAGLVAVAAPVHAVLGGTGLPAPAHLVAVGASAAPAYLLTLRLAAPGAWRELRDVIARVLPAARRDPVVGRPVAAG
jgi:PST family polysaccharide transporter